MSPRQVKVTSPVTKFFIGAIATACAILLPRLIPTVFQAPGGLQVSITWEWKWVMASAVVCALVGAAVMLKEWGIASHPGDTFAVALGLPALLAGMFNVHTADQRLLENAKREAALSTQLGIAEGIQTRPAPATPTGRHDRTAPGLDLATLERILVMPAYAFSRGPVAPQFASQVTQSRYWIVLARDPIEQVANNKADDLKRRLAVPPPGKPSVVIEIVKSGDEFLVVEAGGPRLHSEAMLRAVSLRREHDLSVGLQEVPKK